MNQAVADSKANYPLHALKEKKMKVGTSFEHLTTEVFTVLCRERAEERVEHNVILDGPDGPRQIDVLISGRIGPFEAKTIVECKDYNKLVDVTAVDALSSKLHDVDAQKAVLVARKGFSRTAKKKAKRLGISLCTIQSMEEEKWKFDTEIPILLTEIACEKISPSMTFTAISEVFNVRDFLLVNGVPLTRLVAEYWNKNEIDCPDGTSEHVFIPDLPQPHWVSLADGRRMEVSNLKITMEITKSYYFGHANSIKSATYINFIDKNERTVLFNPDDLSDYRETMSKFTRPGDVPKIEETLKVNIKILREPEMKVQ